MVRSYVLVTADTGRALAVREAIEGIEGVAEAHVVAGDYDVVAEVEGESTADLLRDSIAQVRDLRDVDESRTYVSIE